MTLKQAQIEREDTEEESKEREALERELVELDREFELVNAEEKEQLAQIANFESHRETIEKDEAQFW